MTVPVILYLVHISVKVDVKKYFLCNKTMVYFSEFTSFHKICLPRRGAIF